jgi:cytoplasmic iron level regulating protein YaaA (DUF328/UPF0246 family)
VIVLLPPSETKRVGGDGPPLRLEALSSPTLGPMRAALVDELVELAADRSACRRALGISASQDPEIDRNAALRTAPTLPAINRYTGVLYDALDVETLRGAAATRARARLAVASALFGLLRADDLVPAYRLSATSKLPGGQTLAARWRPPLEPVGVIAEHADGRRTVVSHFNKAHKGRLARALATTRSEPDDAATVASIARRAGMVVERNGTDLTVVIPA